MPSKITGARAENRQALNAIIAEFCGCFDRAPLIDRFNAAGIPCGPVNSIDQTFTDPQVRHLGDAQSVDSGRLGRIGLLGQPYTLDRTPSALAMAAPEAGKHSDEILREFGFGQDEIAQLKEARVG